MGVMGSVQFSSGGGVARSAEVVF